MMVETRLRVRGDNDQKKRLWCCVNSRMREYAFSAQKLRGGQLSDLGEGLAFGLLRELGFVCLRSREINL